jgi:hypothetical protein
MVDLDEDENSIKKRKSHIEALDQSLTRYLE